MRTITQICEEFSVSRETVLSWIEAKLLVAIDVSPAGSKRRQYRFTESAVEEFRKRRSSAEGVRQKPKLPVKQFV